MMDNDCIQLQLVLNLGGLEDRIFLLPSKKPCKVTKMIHLSKQRATYEFLNTLQASALCPCYMTIYIQA